MKSFMFTLLACAGVAMSGHAQANADLAKSKNCMGCHAMDKKVIGPGFRDVAVKYKGQKDAQAKLAASITKGSTGVWGPMAMPPNSITPADSLILAKWVLAAQ